MRAEMLAGSQVLKADRTICRFVAEAESQATIAPKLAKDAVFGATALLNRNSLASILDCSTRRFGATSLLSLQREVGVSRQEAAFANFNIRLR
jgi:hypothetical protein